MKLEIMKKWIGFDATPATSIVYWAKHPKHFDLVNQGYIGITYKTLEERKQRHFIEAKTGIKNRFKNAIRRYGDIIEWSIVCSNITELMSEKIEYYLRRKENIGWNNAIGGGKPPKAKKGVKRSEEFKRNISERQKGKKQSEYTKLRRSESMKGKNKGKKITDKNREKLLGNKNGCGNKGKLHTKKQNNNHALKMKGNKNSLGFIKNPKQFYLEIPFIKSNLEASKKFNISINTCKGIKEQYKKGIYNWIFEEAGLHHLCK